MAMKIFGKTNTSISFRLTNKFEILGALGEYQGAVIMVSHDEGAVQALKPERVILLPDGDEDIWKEEYFDLVSID